MAGVSTMRALYQMKSSPAACLSRGVLLVRLRWGPTVLCGFVHGIVNRFYLREVIFQRRVRSRREVLEIRVSRRAGGFFLELGHILRVVLNHHLDIGAIKGSSR